MGLLLFFQLINLISFCSVYSIKRRDFNTSDTKDNKFDDSIASTTTTTTTFSTNKNMAAQNNSPKTPVDVGPTTQEGMPTSLRSVNKHYFSFPQKRD